MSPAMPQENPKLEAQNTRQELQKLRQSIEGNVVDPNHLQNIKDSAASLRTSYETLRQKIKTFKTTQPTHPDLPKYASILTAFDAVDIDSDPSMTEGEFFAAVTDGLIAPDPANSALLQYEKLAVAHIVDEEKALAAVMSVGAKFESAITGFVEKAQKKFGGAFGQLESLGISIGASDIARYLMNYVADYIDGLQIGKLRPMRGLSQQLREYQGIMEARAKGITDPKVIQDGIAEWNKHYSKWMEQTKNDPHSSIESPKLVDAIVLADIKTRFDATPAAVGLLGAANTIELRQDEEPVAVLNGAAWKISMPLKAIQDNGPAGFALSDDGKRFKEVFDIARTRPAVTEIHRGSFSVHEGKFTAELGGTMTAPRLQQVMKFLPQINYTSVQLETDAVRIDVPTPLARCENKVLFVNKATLDTGAAADVLSAAVIIAGPATTKWQWDAARGTWNVA